MTQKERIENLIKQGLIVLADNVTLDDLAPKKAEEVVLSAETIAELAKHGLKATKKREIVNENVIEKKYINSIATTASGLRDFFNADILAEYTSHSAVAVAVCNGEIKLMDVFSDNPSALAIATNRLKKKGLIA